MRHARGRWDAVAVLEITPSPDRATVAAAEALKATNLAPSSSIGVMPSETRSSREMSAGSTSMLWPGACPR